MKLLTATLLLLTAGSTWAGPSLTSQTPVSNFRLPTFTSAGYRSMLLQGAEAIVGANRIELVDLNLTLFDGSADAVVETILLSPNAIAEPEDETVHGIGFVRVIRDDLEITGSNWTYDHRQKKVSIAAHARVIFHAQLPDILK